MLSKLLRLKRTCSKVDQSLSNSVMQHFTSSTVRCIICNERANLLKIWDINILCVWDTHQSPSTTYRSECNFWLCFYTVGSLVIFFSFLDASSSSFGSIKELPSMFSGSLHVFSTILVTIDSKAPTRNSPFVQLSRVALLPVFLSDQTFPRLAPRVFPRICSVLLRTPSSNMEATVSYCTFPTMSAQANLPIFLFFYWNLTDAVSRKETRWFYLSTHFPWTQRQ